MDIRAKAMAGLKLDDVFIMDCHGHIGSYESVFIPDGAPEDMMNNMDYLGIDMIIVSATAAICSDFRRGNDITVGMVNKYPDRVAGYVVVDPHYPEMIADEIDRCFKCPGVVGLKFHPSVHQTETDHPAYHIGCEIAEEKKCPVLVHIWGAANVRKIGRLAEQYPNAQFIMGHTGGPEKDAMQAAVEMINKYDNLYSDITISYMYEGNLEWFVKEIGTKKILYGTDMPFIDPRPNYGRVALAEITDDEKRDIFGLNIKRILNMA